LPPSPAFFEPRLRAERPPLEEEEGEVEIEPPLADPPIPE
jgi:hypothetical protein